jgi:hypothetical protein
MENGTFNADTITIPSLSGTGAVNVSEGSTVTFTRVDENTKCSYGTYGEITTRCTIVGGVNALEDTVNQFPDGTSGYHYYKYGGKATSVWILSKEEVNFDPNKCIYVDQTGGTDPADLKNIDNTTKYGTMGEPVKTLQAAYLLVTDTRHTIVFVSAYTYSGNETLAEPVGSNIAVTWCANDGLTNYQEAGIFSITGGNSLHLPSDTTFEKMTLARTGKDDGTIYCDGHTTIVEETVTASNLNLYGDGGSGTPVNQVNLTVKGGNWVNVGLGGGIIGDAGSLNQNDNTVATQAVTVAFEESSYTRNVYMNGTVYGKTTVSFDGNSGANTYSSAGTYYGDVTVTMWGSSTGNKNSIDGTYYGSLTYTHTQKSGTISATKIGGKYYKDANITFDETCKNTAVGINADSSVTVAVTEAKNGAKVSINMEEGSEFYSVYLEDPNSHELDCGGNANGSVQVNMAGVVSTVNSNSKIIPATGYDISLIGNETNGYEFTLQNLYGWDKVEIGEGVRVTVDDTEVTANGLALNKNALLLSPSTTTLGTEENAKGSLSLAEGSELRCLDVLKVYGSASGTGGQLTLNHKPDTHSVITGNVTGTIYLDTAYQYVDNNTAKGQFLETGTGTSRDNLKVKESNDEGFQYAISELSSTTSAITWRFGRVADHSMIYLKDTGDDTKNGLSVENAVATLYQAFELVEPGGTIVICDNTTVTTWPSNDYKDITYTSYDGKIDYSDENGTKAIFTIPNLVMLHSNTTFESVNVYGLEFLCANENEVTFGVENPADGQSNFRSEYLLNVTGAYLNDLKENSQAHYPMSITIHAGTFNCVNPLQDAENKNGNVGAAGETVIQVTMTGGTVNKLGLASCNYNNVESQGRDPVIGNAVYNLSGGTVKELGNFGSAAQNHGSSDYTETYNISGTFRFDAFYAGTSREYDGAVTLNITNTGTGDTEAFAMICYGNSIDNARQNPFTVNLTNARVKLVKGGNSSQGYTGGDVTFNLYDQGIIDEIYCGSSTSMGNNVKKVEVNLLSDSAKVKTLYSHGYDNGANTRATEIQVTIAEGIETKVADFDFIETSVDLLQVGITVDGKDYVGYASLTQTNSGKFTSLTVCCGSRVDLARGVSFAGTYTGSNDEANPARMYLPDAGNVSFGGAVSGYTEVKASDDMNFASGFVVSGASGSKGNFTYTATGENKNELSFTNKTTCIWKVAALTGEESDVVYVNGASGVDQGSTQGTLYDPVKTLAYAYQLAESRYEALLEQSEDPNLSEEEKAEVEKELKKGITICVKDSIKLGDFAEIISESEGTFEVTKVTVKGDGEGAKIIFDDNSFIYRLPVATTIENIVLSNETTQNSYVPTIYAEGNKLTIESNVTTNGTRLDYVIYGGSNSSEVNTTELEINGGTWNQIYGGSYSQKVNGKATLILGENVVVKSTNTQEESYGAVFGGGATANATVGSVEFKITGGAFDQVYGGGYQGAVSGNIDISFSDGTVGSLYGGGLDTPASGQNVTITIGGSQGKTATVTKSVRGGGLRGTVQDVKIYLKKGTVIDEGVTFCAGGYAGAVSNIILNVEDSADVRSDIYGGGYGVDTNETYGNVTNNVTVNVDGGTIAKTLFGGGNNGLVNGQVEVNVKNGTISGNVYGGGNAAGVKSSSVTLTGGTIGGDVFGGSYNIERTERQIQESSTVKVGENISVDGAVFGGSDTSGTIKNTVEVTITGKNATVNGGVFGGGSKASLEITPKVTVEKDAEFTGNIYGGGKGEAQKGITAKVKRILRAAAALVSSSDSFNTADLTDANVPSTNVTINGTVTGNIYGGGEYATVGSADSATWKNIVTTVIVEVDANIIGNVYGGGKGEKGKDYAVIYGCTSVTMNGGTIQAVNDSEDETNGAVFGGGEIAPVAGSANVTVNGGIISNIFGGNDQSGAILGGSNVTVTTDSTTEVAHLYGGGRDADIEMANVLIQGGKVGTAYAGGNSATVKDSATLTVNTTDKEGNEFIQHVETVFAGNNQAKMAIQPKLVLTSGKIGTVYCGGNAGIMTKADGLTYNFDYPNIVVENVFAGCNATSEKDNTANVKLTLISGTYGNVYGGNNASGQMEKTNVVINKGENRTLTVNNVYGGGYLATSPKTSVELVNYAEVKETADAIGLLTIYGGGNRALVDDANVQLNGGWAYTVYGGGNAATVEKTTIKSDVNGTATVEKLFCGNNAANMTIQPDITGLSAITITEFYGGGNKGKMITADLPDESLTYTLNNQKTRIKTLYGGCNQADVENKVILNIAGATIGTVYGGCNTSGTMTESVVYVKNDVGTVYGGGCGENTSTTTTNVYVQNGTISGNVYGGSGLGYADKTYVVVQEETENDRIVVEGSVFGAGYGVSSVARETHVTVNMALNIDLATAGNDCDLLITANEGGAINGVSSGETNAVGNWQGNRQKEVSVIQGNVYGGGDMGKVGNGFINTSSNTAEAVTVVGSTNVEIVNGYIASSVFGGGNGAPSGENTSYTVYMGTVFGSSNTVINGGYISGSVYGCGNQSRTYAIDGKAGTAAVLTIEEKEDGTVDTTHGTQGKPIVIGTSIFGGGNKDEGTSFNPSVYTVVGSTTVNITGLKSADNPTAIYLLSENRGGVYGDGNLCLVKGTRTVNITNFNRGRDNLNKQLKTFYSLQRADVVNLTNTRIVLEGAEDLVDANAGTTLYSINRVGQLNMKENSAIKLTEIVNLLGGLWSDCNTDTKYIDKGNNGSNYYITRNGAVDETVLSPTREEEYRKAYNTFKDISNNSTPNDTYLDNQSFNVVCVANGKYLEVKQSDTQYGNVTGMFILQLLYAEPGVGGGFVYANIGEDGVDDGLGKGSTGDFICVTPKADGSEEYMQIVDNVGGYDENTKDYTYYYWYIKGGNTKYKVTLNGYIGTSDTAFAETVMLPTLNLDKGVTTKNTYYVLKAVSGSEPTTDENSKDKFNKVRLVDSWDDNNAQYTAGDCYAIEVRMSAVLEVNGNKTVEEQSIGYLSWDDTDGWSIKGTSKTAGKKNETTSISTTSFTGAGDTTDVGAEGGANNTDYQENISNNTIYTVPVGTKIETVELTLVLHKGTGVTTEIKNVPNTIEIEVKEDNTVSGQDTSELIINSYTYITRIVPTQAAYMSSGRQYAVVASDSPVTITQNSAFTVQYYTRYMPSVFGDVTETLTLNVNEKYLWSEKTGVGFTVVEDTTKTNGFELVAVTEGLVSEYQDRITKTQDGYKLTQADETSTAEPETLQDSGTKTSQTTFPKGTTITLVAQFDDYAPTYWYYYCTQATSEIPLSNFVQMNAADNDANAKYSMEKASGGYINAKTSNRITENLIFVVDFANIELGESENVSGTLQLKHSYKSGTEERDIMDYITEVDAEDGTTTYDRFNPVISNTFAVVKDTDGLSDFTIGVTSSSGADSSNGMTAVYEKDKLTAEITITPDNKAMNTQYDEREYSVLLTLEKDDEAIAFPDGTVFRFQGDSLEANAENKGVIIPVGSVGTKTVEIETALTGYDPGEYKLNAVLYSASVASYYNNLATEKKADTTFTVVKAPTYALSVKANGTDASQIVSAGESLDITVKAKNNGTASETNVAVELYQYQKGSEKYTEMDFSTVFSSGRTTVTASDSGVEWKPVISESALPGTYRLQFTYGDKVEYLDFIVQ